MDNNEQVWKVIV